MTQEEKQLLLQDLCARLPYGVTVKYGNKDFKLEAIDADSGELFSDGVYMDLHYDYVIPYLRPMSSMTEEEREELSCYENSIQRADFYYSHHIDCRFMIEKGLALEAPEGMYNTKEK